MIAGLFLYACWKSIQYHLPAQQVPLVLTDRSNVPATSTIAQEESIRIDLNQADRQQLLQLPGIGQKTAEAILTLRDALGGFRYPEDLLLVDGIGAKKLDTIYDMIYVSQ